MSATLVLPRNYYHCLLGNGLDAVLIGPTGSMVADKAGKDRCYWYKADRYYPEDKLMHVVDSRFPLDKPLEHAQGSGWYEIAPLGRTWYEVIWQGQPLVAQASEQRFVPQEGSLYSTVDYGPVRAQVTTFLHASQSLLIERYVFDHEVEFRAWMGPGVWVEEDWDTDPFYSVSMAEHGALGRYDLGETQGLMGLWLEPAPIGFGAQGRDRWLSVQSTRITKIFAIRDNRQEPLETALFDRVAAAGYDTLRQEHLNFWRDYFAASSIEIPDEQFQRLYEASLYHFKAMQNGISGGLPVNNLRLTWSSHIFWDSYFIQRALLESNHCAEALEACRFFQRTLEHARRHAKEEFGFEGLKWDWEITHDGRKAYGVYLHQKNQVHNNGSYANEIWQYYEFTHDQEMLSEFYPILEGLARFFLAGMVEHTTRGYEIRSLVGLGERPELIKNEAMNLSAIIAILRHAASAARILQVESDFTRRCAEIARKLMSTLDRLYNGRFFASAEGSNILNLGSLAPMYPMQVLDFNDPRGVQTAQAFLEYYKECHKRYLAVQVNKPIGFSHRAETDLNSLPWLAGCLATVLAHQGKGDAAWEIIESTRPAICTYGGITEVIVGNQWNMQYFSTAQGAICTAIHHLLLQARRDEIRLFPALPKVWMDKQLEFNNLLASGLSVSATLVGPTEHVKGSVQNIALAPLTRQIGFGQQSITIALQPGETQSFEL